MKRIRYGSAAWNGYLAQRRGPARTRPSVERAVAAILRQVRRDGDAALVRLGARFDGVRLAPGRLRVAPRELRALASRADPGLRAALGAMADRVEAFHRPQLQRGYRLRLGPGSWLEQQLQPLDAVGLYVPGGAGAYPSSVLMNAIPARLAGVPRIAVATPPRTLEASPALAAALELAGVDEVYRIGGAQAVAAFAFGTRRVAAVSLIVGPGNAYVAAAKRAVRDRVAVDAEAGPSEVVVLADASADPGFVAADLLAQAEHGSGDEMVALVTPAPALADEVARLVAEGVRSVSNPAAARRALARRGAIVDVRDVAEGVAAVSALAPEHAQVMVRAAERVSRRVVAGAVFVGPWSPVAVGDYGIGPNHVLPTGGTARFGSPLSVRDFQRLSSRVRLSQTGLRRAAPGVVAVAEAEGFRGHALSVRTRFATEGP